jgi:hypothetical protein
MARAGQQQLTMWTDTEVKQHIMAHVATSIQRFNAMSVLAADASMRMTAINRKQAAEDQGEEEEQEQVLEVREAQQQEERPEHDIEAQE